MKVLVYKEEGGSFSVLVQASPGKARPPVLIQGVSREDLVSKTLPIVKQMRRPKGAPLLNLG